MIDNTGSETTNLIGEYFSSPYQAFRFFAHPYREILKRRAPSGPREAASAALRRRGGNRTGSRYLL
jgi:hypothetical protein